MFGHGSLIWKVDFPLPGQTTTSTSNKAALITVGVPGKPERIVTLVEEPGSNVQGVAYKLPVGKEEEGKAQLNPERKEATEL